MSTTGSHAPIVNCDDEANIISTLTKLVQMTIALIAEADVEADMTQVDYAIDGLIHGTAEEILSHTLYLKPEYNNLRARPLVHHRRICHRFTHVHYNAQEVE